MKEMAKRVVMKTEADARTYLASRGVEPGTTVERNGVTYVVEPACCGRCGGGGYGPWYPDSGICYDCRGANTRDRTKSTKLVVWARAERRREMAAARKAAKREAWEAEVEARREAGERRWCNENTPYGPVTFEERDALREAERKAATEKATHLDVPLKKRVKMELTLKAVFSYDTHYGTTMVYKWTAPCGATVVWKTDSGSSSHWVTDKETGFERRPEVGETVRAKFTVKEHGEYRGAKETTVTRLVVSELVSSSPKAAAA
jgi:hypothetical protein